MHINTKLLSEDTVCFLMSGEVPDWLEQPGFINRSKDMLLSDIKSTTSWTFDEDIIVSNRTSFESLLKQTFDAAIYEAIMVNENPATNTLIVTVRKYLKAALTKLAIDTGSEDKMAPGIANKELSQTLMSRSIEATEFFGMLTVYGYRKTVEKYAKFEKARVDDVVKKMIADGEIKGGILGVETDLMFDPDMDLDLEPADDITVDDDLSNSQLDDVLEPEDSDVRKVVEKEDERVQKILTQKAEASKREYERKKKQRERLKAQAKAQCDVDSLNDDERKAYIENLII